jgi:hypothetical protein
VEGFAVDSAGQLYGATWGDGVLVSTDDGLTWGFVSTGIPSLNISCLATRAPDEVFAGTFWGVARSTNAGDSRTDISAGLGGAVVAALAVDARGDLLASIQGGGVYRTTDDGQTWMPDTVGLSGLTVHAFASAGGALSATAVRVYRTTDVVVQSSSPRSQQPWRMHRMCSLSGPRSVRPTTSDSSSRDAQRIHGSSRTSHPALHPVTGQPSFRTRTVTRIAPQHRVEETNPVAFTLEQNYPNPFNPSTTIRYGLPQRAAIRLMVLNTLGQEVATLVQRVEEAGYHEVKFDASGLSSGVNYYRLQGGSLVLTRKLLLLRRGTCRYEARRDTWN